MGQSKTRAMVEGAIFASLTTVLGVLMAYVPFLKVLVYIWPVPIIIVGFRNGVKVSVLSSIAALVLISAFSSPINGISLFVAFALPSVTMGYLLNRREKPAKVILITAAALILTTLLSFVAAFYGLAPAVTGNIMEIRQDIEKQLEEASEKGVDEATITATRDITYNFIDFMFKMIPYILISGNITFAFINFKLTILILKRIGYKMEDLKRFTEWRIPQRAAKPLMALLLAILLLKIAKIDYYNIVENALALIMVAYSVVGIAAGAYFFKLAAEKYEIPKPIRYIIIIVAVIILRSFFAPVGLVDSAMDIRKWASKPGEV